MGVVAERLDAMEVKVFSPDGQVKGRLTAGDAVDIRFKSEEYFRDTPAETLSHQLGRVLTLLVVGRMRERHRILEESGFEVHDEDQPHWDKRMRRFHAERDKVTAAGRSASGEIAIATIGLREFKVRFDRNLNRRLSTTQFTAEFRDAVAAMVTGYTRRMAELKSEFL